MLEVIVKTWHVKQEDSENNDRTSNVEVQQLLKDHALAVINDKKINNDV